MAYILLRIAAKKVISIMVPVAVTDERKNSNALFSDISRYTKRLRKSEYTTATEAASVGVIMPPYIPPRIITGRMIPPMAGFVLSLIRANFSPRDIWGSIWTVGICVLTRYTLTTLNKKVRIRPGTNVARKHAATDWLVTKAYIIIVMLGGIRVLRTEEALMIAAE